MAKGSSRSGTHTRAPVFRQNALPLKRKVLLRAFYPLVRQNHDRIFVDAPSRGKPIDERCESIGSGSCERKDDQSEALKSF